MTRQGLGVAELVTGKFRQKSLQFNGSLFVNPPDRGPGKILHCWPQTGGSCILSTCGFGIVSFFMPMAVTAEYTTTVTAMVVFVRHMELNQTRDRASNNDLYTSFSCM